MRLSMHILADWLKKYSPKTSISSGRRIIRNVRLFSDQHPCTPNNVYVSRDAGGVICVNMNDYIHLQTDDVNQVFNDIMDAFDYYNGWSDRLNQQLSDLTFDEILMESAPVVGRFLMLADASYYVISHSEIPDELKEDPSIKSVMQHGIMDMQHILNVEKDRRIRERNPKSYVIRDGKFPVDPSVRNLFSHGRHWGWLIAIGGNETLGAMDIQDELGDILERWMEMRHGFQGKYEKAGVFLEILDGSYYSVNDVLYRIELLGWRQDDTKYVYSVYLPEERQNECLALIHKVDEISHCAQSLIFEGKLVTVFHGAEEKRLAFEEKLKNLLAQAKCCCGVSNAFTDIFQLPQQYRLARAAVTYSRAPVAEGEIYRFEDAALYYGLSLLSDSSGDWFAHTSLKKLRDYDRENNTDFYNTLKTFLLCERSYIRASEELGIHRNSLIYRIARINELTGADLDNPRVRLHILFSYALAETRGA